jgi:hypothetical protein
MHAYPAHHVVQHAVLVLIVSAFEFAVFANLYHSKKQPPSVAPQPSTALDRSAQLLSLVASLPRSLGGLFLSPYGLDLLVACHLAPPQNLLLPFRPRLFSRFLGCF